MKILAVLLVLSSLCLAQFPPSEKRIQEALDYDGCLARNGYAWNESQMRQAEKERGWHCQAAREAENNYQTGIGQVGTGWWGGWEFGTKVHLKKFTQPGSILIVRGISNDQCMQAVSDGRNLPFKMIYQHKSLDGFQCEERWCHEQVVPTKTVRVWGSALWFGVHHAVSVTEVSRNGLCP